MVASKAASRAVSVLATTNARDVLKRRNKPYKTEQQKVIAKKRKLDIQVCSSSVPSKSPALQY
jgi:intracellular sulfur oxidation DsrE/DsrF family protein